MRHIVGYFEVLNMQFIAENTDLQNTLLSAFIRPVTFIATDHPELKFELFPDSMVLGCAPESLGEYVRILQRLFRNWSTNYLIVRGGVVDGEADVMSGAFERLLIKELAGIQMWRISGPAVVNAYHLSESNDAGMVCLLSQELADLIREIDPATVTHASPHRFIWPAPDHLESYVDLYDKMLNKNELHLRQMKPHIEATIQFIKNIRNL